MFRRPRLAGAAVAGQLGAWALQWLSCYLLLVALGLEDHTGALAAAAVLFAVNVSAVLPVMPSNLGVFQAACVAVLTGAYGVENRILYRSRLFTLGEFRCPRRILAGAR